MRYSAPLEAKAALDALRGERTIAQPAAKHSPSSFRCSRRPGCSQQTPIPGLPWQKRARRIYNELGSQLRNKTPKRRVKAELREDRTPTTRPNHVWAMDFVHDRLATDRKIRMLSVVGTFSRFSPVVDPRFGCRAEPAVATLEKVCAKVGYPRTIRVDPGSEFICRDLDLWAYARGVILPTP